MSGKADNLARSVLTNTILVSHTVGISVSVGSTATLEATLWGSGVCAKWSSKEGCSCLRLYIGSPWS